jgi:acyl-coenzyme A thioesterase PaaI-like protein
MSEQKKAFQEYYPAELSHCYGCGTNNAEGHHVKSYWQGEQTIARFKPKPCHTAIPGFVYGGLIASLIDCHGTGSASAAAYKFAQRELGSLPPMRFVTAALNINYLAPTPMGVELVLLGTISEITAKKVIVDITVSANEIVCAKGQVVAVKMPDSWQSN